MLQRVRIKRWLGKITLRRFLIVTLVACMAVWLYVADWHGSSHYEQATSAKIEENLYLGGLMLQPPPGTKAVLNLSEQQDPYQCEIHLWNPIRDEAPAPSLSWLRQSVAFVDQQQKAGRTTYVHCWAGVSRGAMVVIAYLMHKHHWSRDRAIEYVRSKRPEISPNPAFMELLLEWERELHHQKSAQRRKKASAPLGPKFGSTGTARV